MCRDVTETYYKNSRFRDFVRSEHPLASYPIICHILEVDLCCVLRVLILHRYILYVLMLYQPVCPIIKGFSYCCASGGFIIVSKLRM